MSSSQQPSSSSSSVKLSSPNNCDTAVIGSMVSSERDRKLKRVWARELRMLERMLKFLFLDVFFRMFTFTPLTYSKKDIRLLADQGFYSVKVKDGSYKRFHLCCVFCNFEFSNVKFHGRELNVANVAFHHTLENPHCAYLRIDRGMDYQKLEEKLGLIDVGLKYQARDGDIRPLKPLYVDLMPKLAPKGSTRLNCVCCMVNVKNVLTLGCNHVTICSTCFMTERNSCLQCVICRTPFDVYCKINLPEPSFGFSREMVNLYDRLYPNNESDASGSDEGDDSDDTVDMHNEEDERDGVELYIRMVHLRGNLSHIPPSNV